MENPIQTKEDSQGVIQRYMKDKWSLKEHNLKFASLMLGNIDPSVQKSYSTAMLEYNIGDIVKAEPHEKIENKKGGNLEVGNDGSLSWKDTSSEYVIMHWAKDILCNT